MQIEEAIDVLRKAKFKATRPADYDHLPKFMEEWSKEQVDAYFDKQEPLTEALDYGIRALKSIRGLEKSSRELLEIIDKEN